MVIKLFASIVLAAFMLVTLITPFAKAQVVTGGTWYHPTFGEYITRVYDQSNPDEIFGERYTQAQVVWIFHALKATLIPDWILNCFSDIGNVSTCLSGVITNLLSYFGLASNTPEPTLAGTFNYVVETNPVSGVRYVRDFLADLHIIPTAQAQGFGFTNLAPIRDLWTGIRNIAYFLLVIAFVFLALMVMFRVKTSPQTVITVQSAIPRVVMVLLFITFSYAIAGFVIDLAYLTLGLLAIAGDSSSSLNAIELYQKLLSYQPLWVLMIIPFIFFVALLVLGAAATVLSGPLGFVIVAFDIIVGLVFLVLILIIWLRIMWVQIKAFITIILLIIFAPIIILGGVFPNIGGFGGWLRSLIAQVAIFPVMTAMFFLAHYLFWSSLNTADVIGAIFAPLGLTTLLNPYGINIGGGSGQSIALPGSIMPSTSTTGFGFLAGLSIMMLVPSAAGMIQSLISRRPFGYGAAIGAPLAVAFGAGTYPLASAWAATGEARRKAFSQQVSSRIVNPIIERFRRS